MKIFSTYFDSEYSFAYYKIQQSALSKVLFLPNYDLLVASYDGNFKRIYFDKENGGNCSEEECTLILKPDQIFSSDIIPQSHIINIEEIAPHHRHLFRANTSLV